MASLGCADTYAVQFHDREGRRPFRDAIEPDTLEWGRVLDDTSEARITVPVVDADCCATMGAIRTWCNDMSIYRDGTDLVWQGPVAKITYGRDSTEVIARDVTSWLSRREIPTTLDYTAAGLGAADLSTIAGAVVRAAFTPDDPNVLQYLQVSPSGVVGERKYLADTVYAGDELRELARTGVDFTTLGHRIIIAGELPFARLNQLADDHFLVDLEVIEDGLSAASRAIVLGEGVTGKAGGVGPCGLLTRIEKEEAIKDQASAAAEAAAIVAAGSPAPLILNVPDGARLAPEAPMTIMELVPGVIAPVASTQTCRSVNADLRLTHLSVSFTASEGEQVKVTFAPVGVELAA
jgi:hypothetical protein